MKPLLVLALCCAALCFGQDALFKVDQPKQIRPSKVVVLTQTSTDKLIALEKARDAAKKALDEAEVALTSAKSDVAAASQDKCKQEPVAWMEWSHYCTPSRYLFSEDYAMLFLEKREEGDNSMTMKTPLVLTR